MKSILHSPLIAVIAAACPAIASAQVTTKPDGEYRSLFGLASSFSAGNTRATSVTLTGEGVRQTDHSKWLSLGRVFYARDENGVTASNLALGTQYDDDLRNTDYFGVGKVDFLRDRPANINTRASLYGGVGRHIIREENNNWDAIIGLGYAEDRYVSPADVNGEMRQRYGRTEAVLSEASTHKLSASTTFKQKIEVYPDLRDKGEYRGIFDTGLSVAMTERLQLTTGLLYRYNTNPGLGLKRYDALFLTGISLRFD